MRRLMMILTVATMGYLSATTIQCSGLPDIWVEGDWPGIIVVDHVEYDD